MEKEKFSVEDINRTGDLRLKKIMNSVVYDNYDAVTALFERVLEGSADKDQFTDAFFSNMKFKIIEKLAEQNGIENPSSKEAWNKVTEKCSLEKLKGLADEIAEYEFKKIKPESK
ncbi:MAG: hypothetical protein NT136_02375 [Candidatus Moranbacteria bacterium]|nr:hypothetical protein [Candidatus Moranbacteria bacterium]